MSQAKVCFGKGLFLYHQGNNNLHVTTKVKGVRGSCENDQEVQFCIPKSVSEMKPEVTFVSELIIIVHTVRFITENETRAINNM